jgi:hypothetical protein
MWRTNKRLEKPKHTTFRMAYPDTLRYLLRIKGIISLGPNGYSSIKSPAILSFVKT